MNKRVKALFAAALMALSAAVSPLSAVPSFAAGQQSNENNTEFARSIINSAVGTPDRFLDRKYPEIAETLLEKTSAITAGAGDVYEGALKLYDWMVMNVTYKWGTFGPDSIGYILEKEYGTCTDFSFTFMSWLRYNGIRAWCASGSYTYGSYRWDHTWCVAEMGGVEYIFDPQIQNHTYERTGEMSHSLFCRAAADMTDNYHASSARYFNYDAGDTTQTSNPYKMQTGNAGQTDYDIPDAGAPLSAPAKEEKPAEPAETPQQSQSASNPDVPEMPQASEEAMGSYYSEPAGGWEILTEEDFLDPSDIKREQTGITAEDVLSYILPYDDVDSDDPYLNGIKYAGIAGLMNGTGSSFDPDGEINRAMLVTVLGRLFGADAALASGTEFEDISGDEWYSRYVSWAASNGLVLGFADGTFRPDATVTREQFYLIMKRVIENYGYFAAPGFLNFRDADDIDSWAEEAVAVCEGAGLIPWRADRLLMPVKTLTRAELADAMLRFAIFRGEITG